MSAPALPRRAILAGLATVPLAPIAACVPTLASAAALPDPVLDLISRHAAALAYRDSIREGDPRQRPSEDAELDLWWELVGTVPTTLAGLSALANHIASYPDLGGMDINDGAYQALWSIAEAFRALLPAPHAG